MSTFVLHPETQGGLALADNVAVWRDTGYGQALRALWRASTRRFGDWFDAWTDPRDEIEAYLARAQNIADLEQRMRTAHELRGGFGF